MQTTPEGQNETHETQQREKPHHSGPAHRTRREVPREQLYRCCSDITARELAPVATERAKRHVSVVLGALRTAEPQELRISPAVVPGRGGLVHPDADADVLARYQCQPGRGGPDHSQERRPHPGGELLGNNHLHERRDSLIRADGQTQLKRVRAHV